MPAGGELHIGPGLTGHDDRIRARVHRTDDLLAIEELDAIEWSPDPNSGGCEHPRWHELYRRIRDAGKSLQAINLAVQHVAPLLDAVGTEGMYLLVVLPDLHAAEELEKIVARYR